MVHVNSITIQHEARVAVYMYVHVHVLEDGLLYYGGVSVVLVRMAEVSLLISNWCLYR